MLLQQVFSPARIKIDLESENREELFEELVDMIARQPGAAKPFPRKEILDALELRESKMSTGIRKGIALPHAMVGGIGGLTGVIGISSKGVDYDALDGQPVFLVFMLLCPPGESDLHLQALKNLARLLEDPEFYIGMLDAKTPERAFSIMKRFEEIATASDQS